MRIKLPLFDNPTFKRLHPLCAETIKGYYEVEGVQLLYTYPNGYGASVIQLCMAFTNHKTWIPSKLMWELGVIKVGTMGLWTPDGFPNWQICFDTEVADDVIKPLHPPGVELYLQVISKLEPHKYKWGTDWQ